MSQDSQQSTKEFSEKNPRHIIQISSIPTYGGKGVLVALCQDGSLWFADQISGEFKEWVGKIPAK